MSSAHFLAPEFLAAGGRSSEKLSLTALQSKMKCDPDGYESELLLIYSQFNSSLSLFQQQSAMSFTSLSGVAPDHSVSKDLADRAMFLAHLTPFYPNHLSQFPHQLSSLLRSSAPSLPSSLRYHLVQALILLINRKIIDVGETLALFMELQTLGDRSLKKLAFTHVVHTIRRMNQKHKNDAKNRALQNILFSMLQQEDESKAKRALVALCDLHRRRVWFDDRTANAICTACFHSSQRIMVAALCFLLDYEKIRDDYDSHGSSSEDEFTPQKEQIVLNKEAVYKAHCKGTVASKKKKKAKLQRVIRSMKRQQRMTSGNIISSHYSPLNHLKDAQGFAEKLFSRIQTNIERFEKYARPHQSDVTNILAAAVQACHHMVPPDAVEPLFRQIVNQFVHDGARPEAISVGLNSVREICLRIPALMTEDLLQDLVLYKKSHEKGVSTAARSLVALFRVLHPSLLHKKDRGRPTNPKARPKLYGEVNVATDVPGIDLLELDDDDSDEDIESGCETGEPIAATDGDLQKADVGSENDGIQEGDEIAGDEQIGSSDEDNFDVSDDDDGDEGGEDEEEDEDEDEDEHEDNYGNNTGENRSPEVKFNAGKRKLPDFDAQLSAGGTSLRALKKVTVERMRRASSSSTDGILSNEDFIKIKEKEAKNNARMALTSSRKGSEAFEIPSSDQLRLKGVNPAKLEINIKKKLTKEEKLALARAGREDTGKYQSRAAVKQKKTGGSSNRQKEHKKPMPLGAMRDKVAKSRRVKKRKQQQSGKQFRGRKAWK